MSVTVCSKDINHNNWWGARFCEECGADCLELKRVCTRCRHEESGRFCTLCGCPSFEDVKRVNTRYTESEGVEG
jgi:hypothetical protein